MAFEGLCISDCMEMKAIADGPLWGGTVGACVRGIAAGLDMALVCHTHDVMHASIDAVETALKDGTLSDVRVAEAFARRRVGYSPRDSPGRRRSTPSSLPVTRVAASAAEAAPACPGPAPAAGPRGTT